MVKHFQMTEPQHLSSEYSVKSQSPSCNKLSISINLFCRRMAFNSSSFSGS